ncbi:MAG: tRNA (adenosine(37)-N6)-threonylcarbamoyltransferase complex ATPase subunit type 1 TsaE [Fimbriimonadales bacterium]
MSKSERFVSRSERETEEIGESLARSLRVGDIVYLVGDLGAGKTTFVRGVLRAIGHEGEVRSPTFNIIHEYATEPLVAHVDLYRLEPKDVEGTGIFELLSTHVMLIEWPDRLEGRLSATKTIRFDVRDGLREITVN